MGEVVNHRFAPLNPEDARDLEVMALAEQGWSAWEICEMLQLELTAVWALMAAMRADGEAVQ